VNTFTTREGDLHVNREEGEGEKSFHDADGLLASARTRRHEPACLPGVPGPSLAVAELLPTAVAVRPRTCRGRRRRWRGGRLRLDVDDDGTEAVGWDTYVVACIASTGQTLRTERQFVVPTTFALRLITVRSSSDCKGADTEANELWDTAAMETGQRRHQGTVIV